MGTRASVPASMVRAIAGRARQVSLTFGGVDHQPFERRVGVAGKREPELDRAANRALFSQLTPCTTPAVTLVTFTGSVRGTTWTATRGCRHRVVLGDAGRVVRLLAPAVVCIAASGMTSRPS